MAPFLKTNSTRIILSIFFFVVLGLLTISCQKQEALSVVSENENPPNIIFVYVDNLGYGDIEPFGATTIKTPNLNRMAAEGRKFTHFCVTAGVCTPSRASAMTGCYAQRVGMHQNERDVHVLRPISPYGLNPEEITVAEILKGQGYATTCIGKWHLGDQPPFLPTRQGFDSYFGIPYSDDMTARTWEPDGSVWPPLPLMENEHVIEAPVDRDYLTKRYTERALDFIESNQNQPFFIYMPQAMPGSTRAPYASPEFRGKSEAGPWGDAVEELDWSLGQILDKLVELGIDKNTLVLWTSDNGSPMTTTPNGPYRGTNAPLFGRGYTTAEGAFRVPTIFWWPGKIPANTVCEELSTTMDLLPTFARLAGSNPPTDRTIDGHNIRSLILGEQNSETPYEAFYYYQRDQLQAVRSGPWKLFVSIDNSLGHPHFPRSDTGPTKPLLFNVVEDISSKNNKADQHPDIVARLELLAEKGRNDLGDLNRPGSGQRTRGHVPNPKPQVLKSLE
ncbi:MAG: sulfatase [Verrucomicrobia bacterium]|nr:sulfatase [Verrucomicrobiota bacterium]MDA1067137.1 sulfatase [Verrucomicrobiota bacterium]